METTDSARLENDEPLSVFARVGTLDRGDLQGVPFLSRRSLVVDHLRRVLAVMNAPAHVLQKVTQDLRTLNDIDGYRFESNGEDPYNRAPVLIVIRIYRGQITGCLGDPTRYIEERYPARQEESTQKWRSVA